jgi:hypothetical protein
LACQYCGPRRPGVTLVTVREADAMMTHRFPAPYSQSRNWTPGFVVTYSARPDESLTVLRERRHR